MGRLAELLDEDEGVVGRAYAAEVVVQDGEDVVGVVGGDGLGVGAGPFEAVAGPSPDVEIGVRLGGLGFIGKREGRVGGWEEVCL